MPSLMKHTALAALIFVSAVPATLAQERPDSLAMTCAQATGLIQSNGAAVVSSGPNLYDRYVSSRAFCSPSQFIDPAFVPTRDTPSCGIGYLCKEMSNNNSN